MSQPVPFPTDNEIVHAIRVLEKASVLRRYYVRHAVGDEQAARFAGAATALRDRVEDDLRKVMARQLVDVLVAPATWDSSPVGFNRCQVCETTGWVISYADARRAIEAKS